MKCDCNTEMICVQDFCGNTNFYNRNHYQLNFWCDWCPKCKALYFGGYWWNIPTLFLDYLPDIGTDLLVDSHIEKYQPCCEQKYWDYIFDIQDREYT